MTQAINGRDLIGLSENEIWDMYGGDSSMYAIHTEDGTVVETTGKNITISYYGWRMHRTFPALKLKPAHIITGSSFNGGIQLKWTEALLWDTWDVVCEWYAPEDLGIYIQVINQDLYNASNSRMSGYVTSLSILDYVEICSDERAQASIDSVVPTEESIREVYDVHEEVVRDKDRRYPNNNVVKSYNAGIFKKIQMLQNISCRGFVTDGDSNIFPMPVLSGFCRGMTTLRDVMTESCSAVKALLMADGPLAATEYLNRRIQLVANVVTRMLRGSGNQLYSCSGFKTISFTVSKRNIRNLNGKYHVTAMNDETLVDIHDKSLIGKTIRLRSPLGCGHRHEGRVCGKCIGEIAWSLTELDNLGQQASMELAPLASQAVMSTKHQDQSSSAAEVQFPDEYRDILRPTGDKLGAMFTKLAEKEGTLIIPFNALPHPNDLNLTSDLSYINPLHFSEVSKFEVIRETTQGTITEKYDISQKGVCGYFTREFLAHIQLHGYEVTAKGDYVIKLKGWVFGLTAFMFPKKHRNMIDFMKALAGMFESTGKHTDKLSNYGTEGEGLFAFSDLVYGTFDVNIAHLEILTLSVLARSPETGDHRIPHVDEPHFFGRVHENMMHRSLSSKFKYEKQTEALYSPSSYVNKNRPSMEADYLFI